MSTPRPRTRERLLSAAHLLIQERGADAVALADIARAAGVSRRAVYLHFTSRTDLFVEMVAWIDDTQGLKPLLERINSAKTASDMMDGMVDAQVGFNPRIDRVAEAIEGVRWRDDAAAAAWQDRLDDRYYGCRAIIERLKAEGRLAEEWSVVEASDLLWTLTSLQTWRDLTVDRGWTAEQYARRMKTLLRTTLTRAADDDAQQAVPGNHE